ncbi:hypothetical protein AAG570_013339 [Ranatra chinensis]|uniref:RNA-directed DNA polymerase n=1 Tax=Ranatra chinensis TaxID=642074 RepID=A0ABD0YGS4_9HEMI
MHEADCEKTAFQFGRGKNEFTRMPFGLRNAPTTFLRLMDEFLEGLNEDAIQIYMDDIIVFSRSEQEHGRHLGQLLQRPKEFGLKASCEKSSFFNESVKFMGHVLSREGIRPDPGKVEAIRELQEPVDVKGVRSITGLVGYYRRFRPSPADRMEGWNSLTKKGAKFVITEDMRKALEWAKTRLCEDPVLRFPNFSLPFVITTDASQVAVGAVLSQVDSGGDGPVAYASKKLTPAESRYSAIERELLGVVWAVEHFRPYVWGRQFQIKTDHKPLVWVEGLKETSARITRWKERLASYTFQITHTKGRDNVVADCLSRMVNAIDSPSPTLDIHEEVTWDPETFDLSLLGAPERESSEPPGLGLLRRRVEEGADLPAIPEAAARVTPVSRPESERRSAELRELLWERGSLNDKARQLNIEIVPGTNVRTSCHRYGRTRTWTVTIGQQATNREEQTALDAILEVGRTYHIYCATDAGRRLMTVLYNSGIIARGSTLRGVTHRLTTVEDPTEQDQLIKDYHVGKTNHRGIRETVAHLRRRYYWMGMERTVAAQLALCVVCARAKYVRLPEEPPQMVTPTPKKPLEVVEADVVFLDGTIRLTMIDRLTRFAACYPLAAETGEQV